MMTFFGLVGIVAFCTAVIALAAGVTWLVVKLSPAKAAKTPKQPEASAEG
jgi:hypothetical protein